MWRPAVALVAAAGVLIGVGVLAGRGGRIDPATGLSSYSPGLSQGGMAARFEGRVAKVGGCVGIDDGQYFTPLVVPDTTFRFDGTTITHGTDRVSEGGTLVVGGGFLDTSSLSSGIGWGPGCQTHSQVFLVSPDH